MNAVDRAVVRVLLSFLPCAGFAQVTTDKATGSIHVSGHVVDVNGNPIASVGLGLVPLDQADATVPITWLRRSDGSVSVSGLSPKTYKFVALNGRFKISPATLDVRAGEEIEIGDIVVHPDVTTNLKLEDILVDRLTIESRSLDNLGLRQMISILAGEHKPSGAPLTPDSPGCDVNLGVATLGRRTSTHKFNELGSVGLSSAMA